MPNLPLSQLIFLGAVLFAFAAFTVTLLSVSLYTLIQPSPVRRPVAREVTPAKRVESSVALGHRR
jgi:hypothetical protein